MGLWFERFEDGSAVFGYLTFGASGMGKIGKPERELMAYLSLHPGSHNLGELEQMVHNASTAARALARKQLVTLIPEPLFIRSAPIRAIRRGPAKQSLHCLATPRLRPPAARRR